MLIIHWCVLVTVINFLLSSQAAESNRKNYYGDHESQEPDECVLTAQPPDINTQCCGVDTTSTNNIVGGHLTSLEQYPWLALIEYRNVKTNISSTACGGFLISGRYVLTAAHCLVGEILIEVGKPVNVHLGEYNRTNDGPDCVTSPAGQKACNDGAVKLPIETYDVHRDFYHDNVTNVNDIGIIRLKTMAAYTDFIRPICLPISDLTANPPDKRRFYTAGWGAFAQRLVLERGKWVYSNSYSNVKSHVDVPLRNIKECREVWGSFISKRHVCAGGEDGKDSCSGDSGGPLMYEADGVFQAVGMVSFGSTKCGAGLPSVYTNVYEFRDWIYSHIKN